MRRAQSPEVTFKGGQAEPFHRWFRLTPSFSPSLVREWLDENEPSGKVLDPFAGAGTTPIVCKRLATESVGVEVNPLLAFVSRVCTDWSPVPGDLADAIQAVLTTADSLVQAGPADPGAFAEELGTTIPPIHNPHRWWRDDVLGALLALRAAIHAQPTELRDHLTLALAAIVYDTANITLGRLQVAFIDRSIDDIPVMKFYADAADRILADLKDAESAAVATPATIIEGDSTQSLAQIEDSSLSGLFTSPPYPNRYSYVWNTRPHLYLCEFVTTKREPTDIDLRTIGGTWGSATTDLQKKLVPVRPRVEAACGEVIGKLHVESMLMGNYVTKYLNDMDAHLEAVRPKLHSGAPVGYVVGNTETKGIFVETGAILSDLLELNGYKRGPIVTLRPRNSGQNLVEDLVTGLA